MPNIAYIDKRFSRASLAVIAQADRICHDYARQGYDLTLRQLYYQFVSKDLIANTEKSYKRLGNIVNDARLAGMLDWNFITDRGRYLRANAHWSTPGDIVRSAASSWAMDRWAAQGERVELWVEKEALAGVVGGVCARNDVAFFPCKGYTSQSEMWVAAQRLGRYLATGRDVTILHLGDHDPSGIDMTRDIEDRLRLFVTMDEQRARTAAWPGPRRPWGQLTVDRIALNMDQVRQYDPPPNPAKVTDSRFEGYRERFGDESWELDALEPNVLVELIEDEIDRHRDEDQWQAVTDEQEEQREVLLQASNRWEDIQGYLAGPQAPADWQTWAHALEAE